jgi:hypothetical protein
VTQLNAKALVEDLRAALPPEVQLLAPDSFAATDVAQELGPAGNGMLVTVPGIPIELLPPAGKRFLRGFGPGSVEPGVMGAPRPRSPRRCFSTRSGDPTERARL